MLKSIKNRNREILSKKYEELTNNYIWIKKYVIGEEINPLIEFVFDNFVPEKYRYKDRSQKQSRQRQAATPQACAKHLKKSGKK